MKKILILLGLILISSINQTIKCQDESGGERKNYVNGNVDHVLATLSTQDYEVLDSFLTEHFSYCWKNQPWKGFISSNSRRPYVEIFNGGFFFQYGYQVVITNSQDESKEKAKAYYGTNGVEYIKGGYFTVGEDGKVGHPLGGTKKTQIR